MAKTPRDYQIRAVQGLRDEIAKGNRSVILESPTGSGKTWMACMVIDGAVSKGKRVVFLAPRRELVNQTSEHLDECGVNHGIIMAGEPYSFDAHVQVATKDTLAARALRRNKIDLPWADILVVDEAHQSLAKEYVKLIEKFRHNNPDMILLGLSATPGRADGKGLGDIYDVIVKAASYSELRANGSLVECQVYAPSIPNMKGVKVRAGDWASDEVEAKMNKPKMTGDIYEHWASLASDRQTVLFASGVRHSIFLKEEFESHGVDCAHIDASTEKDERDAVLRDLAKGDIQVVMNCDVLTLGFDCPPVSCVVLASPTKSLVRYRQRAGRALRPYPGKSECILIDHSGASLMHGYPDDDMDWPLDISVDRKATAAKQNEKASAKIRCNNCGMVYDGQPICPGCGHKNAKNGLKIAFDNGLLKPIKRGMTSSNGKATMAEKEKYWHSCIAIAANKGIKIGAAAHMYKRRFGAWPRDPLPHVPKGKVEWQMFASDLYPQYLRGKQKSVQEEIDQPLPY